METRSSRGWIPVWLFGSHERYIVQCLMTSGIWLDQRRHGLQGLHPIVFDYDLWRWFKSSLPM